MATQQIVPSVVPQSKSAVFPFPVQPPQVITQTELVLFLSLRGRLLQLQEQVSTAEEDLAETVFGKGTGQAYCDEVLASAEPTRTVSLVVR